MRVPLVLVALQFVTCVYIGQPTLMVAYSDRGIHNKGSRGVAGVLWQHLENPNSLPPVVHAG